MFRRFSPLIPYFGVSGRASMKRYKIVDPPLDKLMQLYIQQLLQVERPVLAINHTAWLRPHARTLKERTYEHQPTASPHGIPVGIGQGYSTIALIPEYSGSWALPLRHERITSWDNPISFGAQQWAASMSISSE